MSTADREVKSIDGDGRTIRQLLSGHKYSIDYYQREYKWQQKQVAELLEDLAGKFLDSHSPTNERTAVAGYGHYFLGSIIISDKGGRKFVIDGQQRLTTLTLLLIYLRHSMSDSEQQGQLADLIFSARYGQRSFNLDIPERMPCMDSLYRMGEFSDPDGSESVANIVARYADIAESFPGDLKGDALPFFTDWLLENVHLVEITAYTDEDAYAIFETMNDRGLSLTPADMLKGYLLANIDDAVRRAEANAIWKRRTRALSELGKDEDADGIKAWLRSQYAITNRERRQGAGPQDFDLIGTEFHRWVRAHEEALSLRDSATFMRFIERDFAFYSRWYERFRSAAEAMEPGLEGLYYNAQHKFTHQYALLLAPLKVDDSEATCLRKARIVATYLDILLSRRIWNWRAIDYSTMQYAMFRAMKEIRGLEAEALAAALRARLDADTETFARNPRFSLTKMNGPYVHRLLARMSDYVERAAGQTSRYLEYSQRGRGGYEIEHIWANHPERHSGDFEHASDFHEYRNRIGGLVLLPKSFNASYGDLPYAEKRPHYLEHSLLARSLHEQTYDHSPGFRRFMEQSGLPFRPHTEFRRADLELRQALYLKLAELIWSPDRLAQEAQA